MARKARREPIRREAVIELAIDIADREGLDAVTIRRLAHDTGVTPMALYWHFSDKDAVLDAMVGALLAEVEIPEPSRGAWDNELRAVLDAITAAISKHPNIAGVVNSRALRTSPGLVGINRVLGLLGSAGFGPEEGAEIGTFLLHAVVTLVVAEPGLAQPSGSEDRQTATTRRTHLENLSADQFPHLVAAADFLAGCSNESAYFNRGVELLVSGTRELLRNRTIGD